MVILGRWIGRLQGRELPLPSYNGLSDEERAVAVQMAKCCWPSLKRKASELRVRTPWRNCPANRRRLAIDIAKAIVAGRKR